MSLRFAQLGCRLVLWDVNKSGNEETASQCRKFGATTKCYEINLCNREDIYKVADQVFELNHGTFFTKYDLLEDGEFLTICSCKILFGLSFTFFTHTHFHYGKYPKISNILFYTFLA